jgi:hypothetical protein
LTLEPRQNTFLEWIYASSVLLLVSILASYQMLVLQHNPQDQVYPEVFWQSMVNELKIVYVNSVFTFCAKYRNHIQV